MNYNHSGFNIDRVFFYILSIFVLTLPYSISNWWVGAFSFSLFLISLTNSSRKASFFAVFHKQPVKAFLIFILFTYVSVIWSDSPDLFNGDLKENISRFKYFFLIVPAIYLSNLTKKDIKILFGIAAFAPILSILVYYSNYFGFSEIYPAQHNNNYILRHYLEQNFYILFSALYLYIQVFSALKEKNRKRLILFLALFCIVSISLAIDENNTSRLMLLAYFLILMIVPFYFLRTRVYFGIFFSLLSISSIIIIKSPSFHEGFNNFTEAVHTDKYEGSWGHRLGYTIVGINIFLEKPLLGHGINDISRYINKAAQDHPKYFIGENLRRFHNEHINILVAVGITGYSLLVYFIYVFFRLKPCDKNIYIFKNTAIIVVFFLMIGEHYLSIKSIINFLFILTALFTKYSTMEKQGEYPQVNH